MTQFYLPSIDGEIPPEEAHHIVNARRFKQGDIITVFDGKGHSAKARVEKRTSKPPRVVISVLEKFSHKAPGKEIRLFMALIKAPAFKIAVQKCTELGATRISPLRTARSARQTVNRGQIEKIIINACGQCGRQYLPSLDEVKDFLIGIKEYSQDHSDGFILLEGREALKIRENARNIAIFAGPEGGFTDSEKEAAEKAGLRPVSVGASTLRSETALIAALAIGSLPAGRQGG